MNLYICWGWWWSCVFRQQLLANRRSHHVCAIHLIKNTNWTNNTYILYVYKHTHTYTDLNTLTLQSKQTYDVVSIKAELIHTTRHLCLRSWTTPSDANAALPTNNNNKKKTISIYIYIATENDHITFCTFTYCLRYGAQHNPCSTRLSMSNQA